MKLTDLRIIFNIIGDEDEGYTSFLQQLNQALSLFNSQYSMIVPLFPNDLTEAASATYEHPVDDEVFWRSVILMWTHVWLNQYIYKDIVLGDTYERNAKKSSDSFLSGNNDFKEIYKDENATKVILRGAYAKRVDTSTTGIGSVTERGAYTNLRFSNGIGAGVENKLRTVFDFIVTVEKIIGSTQSNIRVRIKTLVTNDKRLLPLSTFKTELEENYLREVSKTLPDVRYTLEDTLSEAVTKIIPEYSYVSNSLTDEEVSEIENTKEAWRCFEVLFDRDILGI